jgi:hypothetical protein
VLTVNKKIVSIIIEHTWVIQISLVILLMNSLSLKILYSFQLIKVQIQRRRYAIIVTKNGVSFQKIQKMHTWNYLTKKKGFCKNCKSEQGNDTKQSASSQS